MVILDMVSIPLMSRILFVVSSCLSVGYFVLAMFQLIHIIWNKFHFDNDWQSVPHSSKHISRLHTHVADLFNFKRRSVIWMWFGFLALLLLVLIMPILHI